MNEFTETEQRDGLFSGAVSLFYVSEYCVNINEYQAYGAVII